MSNNFYPLTPQTLEKLYKANLTAAEWRLWSYLVINDPWGDSYKDLPDTLIVMEKVAIKKSTFYAALAKFQKFELFDFQDKGFAFRNLQGSPKVRNTVQDSGNFSEISDSFPKSRKSDRKNGKLSKNLENHQPEPALDKGSTTPHTIQTYSDFKKTLSESERESFLEFSKKKAGQLPCPPELPERWIQKNWEELAAQWYKSRGQSSPAQSSKWENDPRCGDWLAVIEETANPLEFAAGDSEKLDFIRWAKETKQFSWLKGES